MCQLAICNMYSRCVKLCQANLISQLVSLEVGQTILGPVLELESGHKRHDSRVLVLTRATTDLHPDLELPVIVM